MSRPRDEVTATFMPLSDGAPLIVACELGFAEQEGLHLKLFKETSWATVRDRLAVGQIDVAHALAPMPLASNFGLGPLPQSLIAPMALGFGGNTITVSLSLWSELQAFGCRADFDAAAALVSLSQLMADRKIRQGRKLRYGIVHPHSAHRYELAYWLASGGIMPDRDVDFVVLPPSLMTQALANGSIDGFCAGEPWGSIASNEGVGKILTTKAHIWRSSPEKVLAVRKSWADEDEDRLRRLIRAIYASCCWCDDPANRDVLIETLTRDMYLGQPQEVLHSAFGGALVAGDGRLRDVYGFLRFCTRAATFPWTSHALWLYTQMVRWGEIPFTQDRLDMVRVTYRPDLYRAALSDLKIPIPSANAKVEGALMQEVPVGSMSGNLTLGPDGFFDGLVFDPDAAEVYISDLKTRDQSFFHGHA